MDVDSFHGVYYNIQPRKKITKQKLKQKKLVLLNFSLYLKIRKKIQLNILPTHCLKASME